MNSSETSRHSSLLLVSSFFATCFSLFLFFLVVPLSITSADVINESFTTNQELIRGSIVDVGENDKVLELAQASDTAQVLGVTSSKDAGSIIVQGSDGNSYVSIIGDVSTLVGDMNGVINRGDVVSVSWLEGVGMRSEGYDYATVGVALEDFNSDEAYEYGDVETPNGVKLTKLSTIPVRLLDRSITVEADQPLLTGLASRIVGRQVSTIRVIIASALFLTALVVVGTIVSSSMKGSFVSIGRNPMASTVIQKSMIRVSLFSTAIVLVSLITAFLVVVL